MKILLVDDDLSLSMALAELLRKNHYAIDLANNGQTGLDLAMSNEYDLILLDWMIPQLDGISLCQRLRSQGYRKPILLLTRRNSNADMIVGLDAGADDYVIKSSGVEVLLARIRALLRRMGAENFACIQETQQTPNTLSKLTWGNLCLDKISGKVTYDRQIIPLTVTEYKLLELFLQNPNRVFSRSVILDRLWGLDDAPIENAVTTHIKDLRKKLKSAGFTQDILETVYGMGYRLKLPPNNCSKPDLTSINRILNRFSNSFDQQVAILEQAKKALLSGNLDPELQQIAQDEAHKLAGSMGIFGYPEGSRLAQEIESLLLYNHTLSDNQVSQFSQLVTALQQELTEIPNCNPGGWR